MDKSKLRTKTIIANWEKAFRAKYPEGSRIPQKAILIELAKLLGPLAEDLDSRLSKVEAELGITPPPLPR